MDDGVLMLMFGVLLGVVAVAMLAEAILERRAEDARADDEEPLTLPSPFFSGTTWMSPVANTSGTRSLG